ncbi:MAG: glycosyltransferase family 39 protein [Chloroflexi bacterium]|nr:glycosyltransferase family 39 protein [Chloroflexota bacterium]
MSSIRKILRYFQGRPNLADLFAVVGMVTYCITLWGLAHNQISVLDEGLYLFKGWLFVTGQYSPFQAYGAWTNQMPLAFLIPGWVEMFFGPGLLTGRMMAIFLGMLMLPAIWLTARRLGGRWIAAGVIIAIVLNPAAARMYALAASQGLVACLLAWTMWFSLGRNQKHWQVLIGGLLAGCTVMVRINMIPLLPLLTLYILWARGWRAMLWSLSGMLFSFGITHLAYWPNILTLWAKWLPLGFLKTWFPPKTIPTWKPDNPLEFRIASFFLAFRYHFAALAGSLATWIFWPKREKITTENFKIAVFLSVLIIFFFLLHAWAALGNEYCVFCFPTYTAFFAGVGLLLTAVTLPWWNLNPPAWRKWLGGFTFLVLLAGMAYSAEGAAENMLGQLFYKRLLATPVPGLNGVVLWQVLANKFQLEYKSLYDSFHVWLPVLLTLLFGLVIYSLPLVGYLLARYAARKSATRFPLMGAAWTSGLVLILLLGSLLAPAPVLAGDYNSYDCAADVIPAYETAGKLLAKSIPAGSKIFWAGYSPVTLLYLPGVEIYPAQLHGAYSFRISTDDDALLKYGWWNQHLAEKWLNEADFILAEQKNLGKNDWLTNRLDKFELVEQSAPQTCHDTSAMFLYRRK